MNPVRQVGDIEIMSFAALSRLKAFAPQAKQPAFDQRFVVGTIVDADP